MERRLVYTAGFVFGLLSPTLATSTWTLLAAAFPIWFIWRVQSKRGIVLCLLSLSFAVGFLRCLHDESHSGVAPSSKMTVEGRILDPPRRWGTSSVFFFVVEKVNHTEVTKPFRILVQWRNCDQSLAPGDEWSLTGKMSLGEQAAYPGAFDQRHWIWSQGAQGVLQLNKFSAFHYLRPPEGWTPHQLAYRARTVMMRRLKAVKDENARSLVAGVVFGETQSLPKEIQEHFRRTGTSHLLAASGMNVALLAGLILGAGKRAGFGPWRIAPLAIPAVVGYAFLAGCGPSITRAAAGTSLALVAMWMGRSSNPWNSLALSVWVLLLWDPRQLYDLGFQLSATAVVGLVGGPDPPKTWGSIRSNLLLTWSASLVTLPFFWCSFGELSSTLLLANLVLGPIVELLFPLGLLATAIPLQPLFALNEIIARISLVLVEWCSDLADPIPLASPRWECLSLLLLAIVFWLFGKTWRHRSVAFPLTLMALMVGDFYGRMPVCTQGELIVRQVGAQKPVYWLSSHKEELLVLSEPWQERRARVMMRRLGCLRSPRLKILKEGENFDFSWAGSRWSQMQPYLCQAPYLEVSLSGEGYIEKAWWP
jgi:ComEC/Rec2-related protein